MLQHVSDHKGSNIRELYIVLGQNYSNGSISSVDMDVVGVMAAYLPVVRVCTASLDCAVHTRTLYTVQYTHSASLDSAVHTRTTGKYAAITPTTSISTDEIELSL